MAVTHGAATARPGNATDPPVHPTVSDALRAHYDEHGWATVGDVFTSDEVDRVSETAMRVSAAELADAPESRFLVDVSSTGEIASRKIDYPFLKHGVFRQFVLDPRLEKIASVFLGRPGYLIRDQLFCKPPRFGTAKPYHQENSELLFEPADQMLVVWVALDDVTEDNGCLRFINGSHHQLLTHKPLPDATYHLVPAHTTFDPTQETVAPVGKGSVVVIHSQTLHSSRENRSDHWRRAYSSHWVTDQAICRSDALKHGYSQTVAPGRYRHTSP